MKLNSWDTLLDCFMTTVCTDRELPDGMDQKLFNQSIAYSEGLYAYKAKYNSSQFSKVDSLNFF